MKLIELKCSKCGAKLEMDSSRDSIFCTYCGTENFIDDEASKLRRVEDAKLESRKKNHEQDLKEQQEKEELEYQNSFKKSKLKKWIIFILVFTIIAIILSFTNNSPLSGIIAIIQSGLLITSLLMGLHVIKEPFKYCHRTLAYIAFALIIVYIRAYSPSTSSNSCKSFDFEDIYYHEQLPTPPKTKGDYNNSSYSTRFSICDSNIKDFNNYRDKVIEKGFIYDKESDIETYKAKNIEGYEVSIRYSDYSKEITIYIDPPIEDKEEEENIVEPEKEEPKKEETKIEPEEKKESSSSIGIRPDFKKAMDSYEKAMDEYVKFMKKYINNPSDTSLLKDYATYLKKYEEAMEDFEKWEDDDLNDAELKYYLEVQNRVNKKLLEVS